MRFALRLVAAITAASIIAACSPSANPSIPALRTQGIHTQDCGVAPQTAGVHPLDCSTPDPCFNCWTAGPPPAPAPPPTEGGPYGPPFSGCLGDCGSGLPSPPGGTPPGVGGPIGHPIVSHGLAPVVLGLQNLLRSDGVSTSDITQLAADEAVRSWYDLTPAEFQPSFAGEAIEGTWTQAVTEAFNGTVTPNLATESTLTSDTLIQFLSPASQGAGSFTTTIGTLTQNNATTAQAIKNLFSLPNAPSTVTAVNGYPEGTRFIIGEAAENEYGAGGGLQIFGESEAVAVGEEMTLPEFLELLVGLAALDKHHPLAPHH